MDALVKAEQVPPSPRDLLRHRYYLHEEEEVHLRDYWRIVLKHRWTVLTFFVIIATTATIYSLTLIPTYQASATIKIDRERPQILSFQEIGSVPVSVYDPEFMGTHLRLLQTRSLATRVADALKASGHPTIVPKGPPSFPLAQPARWLSWVKDRLWPQASRGPQARDREPPEQGTGAISPDALLGMVQVEPVKESNLVKITFTTPSAGLSALLANTWAKIFIDQSLEMKYNATVQAGEWLTSQLQGLLTRLEQSEVQLHEFAKEKQILTIGEKKDIVTGKLADLSEALTRAQGERIAKEALYQQSQGAGFESIPVVLENTLIANLKNEYYKLDSEHQRLSETYKPEYPKMVQMREGINQLKRRLDMEIRRVVEAIRQEYEAALRKETMLAAAVEQQKRLAIRLNQDLVHYDILKREVDTNRQLHASLLERQKQASVSQGLATSNVQIVDLAEAPSGPSGPDTRRHVLLGLLFGLTVGVGLAFFFDYLDNSVKRPEDLERSLRIPTLALIPTFTARKEQRGAQNGEPVFELVTHEDPRSIVTEAFRSLRTSILFSYPGSPPRSILFTSARAAEGKTGNAMNTAITLSQLGSAVLLIDADMRRPTCHTFLQTPLRPGLSDYLTGHVALETVIKRNGVPNLACIPAGTIPVNPAELLASARMKEAIDLLSQRFDYIVVDAPPALGVADALILSTMIQGVILIAHGGVTPRDAVKRAFRNLIELNVTVLGSVLNNVDVRRDRYLYYKYYYYYRRYPDPSLEAEAPTHLVADRQPARPHDSG